MKTLILVTSQYPYHHRETFLENEIDFLSKAFDTVLIYAAEVSDAAHPCRTVPDNVSVFAGGGSTVKTRDYAKSLTKSSVIKEIREHCLGKNLIGKISSCCYFDQSAAQSSKKIPLLIRQHQSVLTDSEVVVYSYWLSTIGMTALNIFRAVEQINSNVRIISRCHRFDLYEDRAYLNYLPFQMSMIQKMDTVYPCSVQGTHYLQAKYPTEDHRIKTAYLGVKDYFNGVYPNKSTNIFSIVSCSNVISVKRVDKLLEAIAPINDVSIQWTHFGDGELFGDLQEEAKSLPKNITVDLKGRVPNSEIYQFYNTHNVNLFVNVSSSEGLPVSIMEAVSFGIPVIATDVGGTGEIVENSINGFLLEESFSRNDLTQLMRKLIKMESEAYCRLCLASRKMYENHFSAATNYKTFCRMLSGEEQATEQSCKV